MTPTHRHSLTPWLRACSALCVLVFAASLTPSVRAQGEGTPATESVAKATTVNPEDLRDYANVVIVPTAYVRLAVEGKISVAQQGGALAALSGRSTNSVRASARYKVSGLDKAAVQQIARQAYDGFVAALRQAGYTVLTYEDIRERDFVRSAARESADATWGLPLDSSRGGDATFLVAAPSDEQQFKSGLAGGVFSEFISLGKPRFTDATVVIPQYTLMAPQAWGEKSESYSTISAEVKIEPKLALTAASATWMGRPKVRMMRGIPGVTMNGALQAGEVGTLTKVDTTSTAANALSKTLSLLSGFGSTTASTAEYGFAADPAAYNAAALKAIATWHAAVAQMAQAAPAP